MTWSHDNLHCVRLLACSRASFRLADTIGSSLRSYKLHVSSWTKKAMPPHRFKRNSMDPLLFVTFQGMGKRKYVQPGQTQHTKSTRDLITWRGNESTDPVSTYRAHYPTSRPSSCVFGFNETEPIHVRSNLELRRRQLRASSAPPSQRRTAPLLAWNEPDEAHHGKPGVGVRQPTRECGGGFASTTPFAHTAPAAVRSQTPSQQSFTVSETIVPLNSTWLPTAQELRSRMLWATKKM